MTNIYDYNVFVANPETFWLLCWKEREKEREQKMNLEIILFPSHRIYLSIITKNNNNVLVVNIEI